MNTKKCSNCFQIKNEYEFYRKVIRKTDPPAYGTQSRCKACNAEVVRAYALRKREKQFPGFTLKVGAS